MKLSYQGRECDKILVVGNTAIGKTLLIEQLAKHPELKKLRVCDDFWMITHPLDKEYTFKNNDVLTSQMAGDFGTLVSSSKLVIIDLNILLGTLHSSHQKMPVIEQCIKDIKITQINSSATNLVCVCPDDVWRFKGCKCGAIKPYVFKY